MSYFLVKYDNANAKNRPVDEANDIFGLKGIRLGGTLFDQTNIALKSEVNGVQGNLTALQNAYNAHVYLQNQDLAAIRNDVLSLYAICQNLGLDINAIINDLPKEEEITATASQTVFTATTITWSEFNDIFDLVVERNGQVLHVNRDYTKINNTQIQLIMDNPVYAGEVISLRVERSLLSARFNSYFLSHITNSSGRGIFSPTRYSPSTEKLIVWRNGLLLVKSNTLGVASDRYEETTSSMITLGEPSTTTDVITLLNRTTSPAFRTYQTGITGTSVPVPSYTTGNRTLKVFRNGVLMNSDSAGDLVDQYSENSSTSILLSQAATSDEIFAFECSASIPAWMEVQTGFSGNTLTFGSSFTESDKLLVFRNGRLMYRSLSLGDAVDRYTEASSTSITLETAAQTTDWFAIVYSGF